MTSTKSGYKKLRTKEETAVRLKISFNSTGFFANGKIKSIKSRLFGLKIKP